MNYAKVKTELDSELEFVNMYVVCVAAREDRAGAHHLDARSAGQTDRRGPLARRL